MCDTSDYAIGAVLGQRKYKKLYFIDYASRILIETQMNYATIDKDLSVVLFAFDKFCSYLIDLKEIEYTDHSSLKFLLAKKDVESRLIRWILLLQEFDLEIKYKRGTKNLVANHL